MMPRIRIALPLVVTAALALPAGAAAIAAPTPPVLADPPEFAIGTSITPSWSASAFTPLSKNRAYRVEVHDLQTGDDHSTVTDDLQATVGGRQNGHTSRVRVQAMETRCAVPAGNVCLAYAALPVSGVWSDPVTTRTDTTDPSGSVSVNGGATYTASRAVTLNLTASDPLSSGVGGVQISPDTTFTCNLLTDTAECPVPMAATRPFTLPEGADGARTVWVKYRDRARSYAPKGGFVINLGAQGNGSPATSGTIILDRSKPTPVVTAGVPAADAGVPVGFSAAASTDATSGIDTASATWSFGDGTAPVKALQLNKTFANPGTYNGTLTVSDRAGNTSTQAFSFTVTGAPAPGGGGVQVTDPGKQTGSPAGGAAGMQPGTPTTPAPVAADDLIRGAARLNRAVQGRTLRIRVRVAERTTVRVAILRVTSGGRTIVRRQARAGGPGFVLFTFTAPTAGRHLVRVRAGADTLSFPMGIAKR